MSYNLVQSPRFYVDDIAYMKSIGIFEMVLGDDVFDSNPSNIYSFTLHTSEQKFYKFKRYNIGDAGRPNYFALLGHNLARQKMGLRHAYYKSDDSWDGGHNNSGIVNGDGGIMDINSEGKSHATFLQPQYDGFSIVEMTNASDDGNYLISGFNFEQDFHFESPKTLKFGSLMYGRFYDMPHSPDLSLTLSYDYKGIKTIETKGGASLSNNFYSKPAMWGELGARELSDNPTDEQKFSRSGRRIWDLSFSYLDDGDIFGANPSLATTTLVNETGDAEFDTDDTHDTGEFKYNILTDNSFYSQVIHKTQPGLPFIFQPDKDYPEFAICKFEQKKFDFRQTAPGFYSVKCRIREVW